MLEKASVLEFNISGEIYLVIDGASFPNDMSFLVHKIFI